MSATSHLRSSIQESQLQNSTFLAIMVIGITISLASIVIIVRQIWVTERNKAEILSLYALLRMYQIKKVYDQCNGFLDKLL